ncbi:uncharacterized protein [Hoplias malabaricus]
MCQSLDYSLTVMPNILGHTNQEDADLEISQFYPLVKVQCSSEMKTFLCSVYSPQCVNGTARPVCKTTCETAKMGCEPLMRKFGIVWPSSLACETFTTESCEEDLTASQIQQKRDQMGHTVGEKVSASLGHPEKGRSLPPGKCEPIEIPMCKGLHYHFTVMPNILGHKNQEEADLEISQFYPLVSVQCSSEMKNLLCSVYSPQCVNGTARPVCKTTCETAKMGCEPLMRKFGFVWPSSLACETFTTESCEEYLSASQIQKKLVQMGHTVGDQVLSLQTVRILMSLKDDERSGKLDEHRFQELQSYVSAAKKEFVEIQQVKDGAVSEKMLKSALKAHDLRLNDLNFGLLWNRYNTAGQVNFDEFVAILARLETLKDRFKSHRMTNLPCDCVMASFSLDDFIRDTLL